MKTEYRKEKEMEYSALICIADQKPEEAIVKPIDRNRAFIYITAATFETGFQLIRDNIEFAREAAEEMSESDPETVKPEVPEPAQDVIPEEETTGERLNEKEAALFERMTKRLMAAREFSDKHGGGELLSGHEIAFLGDLTGCYEKVVNSYYLGFQKGFRAAQRAAKRRKPSAEIVQK